MSTQANVMSRRSRNAKSLCVVQNQDCDSESEAAVTSTSGQTVKTLPVTKGAGRRKQPPRSPGMSRSRGASRSPGVSMSKPPDVVSVSPAVSKSLALTKSREPAESPITPKSPVASESNNATDLRVASKAPDVGKQPSPSKKRRCLATVVKEEEEAAEVAVAALNTSTGDPSPQRLLMREWLLQEVERSRIPGLGWLDRERRLIRIPWIHASKDVWSKDSHCKLFENWAIYTGKYDASKQKPDHKRWKANFRCALNSLGDIQEERELSKKNGSDGYRVYRVDDAIDRKGHRKHKVLNPSAESVAHFSERPPVHRSSEIIPEEHMHQPVQALESNRTSPVPVSSHSSLHMHDFTDSLGQPIFTLPPGFTIACRAEVIRDTFSPGDGSYTSLSNVVVSGGNGPELPVVKDNEEMLMTVQSPVSRGGNYNSGPDIVSLRNLDHNYFKAQIPTTVENFVDEDGAEPSPKTQRRNDLR